MAANATTAPTLIALTLTPMALLGVVVVAAAAEVLLGEVTVTLALVLVIEATGMEGVTLPGLVKVSVGIAVPPGAEDTEAGGVEEAEPECVEEAAWLPEELPWLAV